MNKNAWIFKCRWGERPESNVNDLVEFFLNRVPASMYPEIEGNVSGKRWPNEADFSKLVDTYKRRGAKDVSGLQILYKKKPLQFYLFVGLLEWRKYLVGYFKGFEWEEEEVGEQLRELVCSFRLHYCQGAQSPEGFGGLVGDDYISYKDVPKSRKDALMMYRYFEARNRWYINQNVDTGSLEPFDRLAYVYRYNVLSDVHLNAVIPKLECRLEDWIKSSKRHGRLDRVTQFNSIWYVTNEQQKHVISKLWHTGLFPVDEYFELVGWSDDLSIPVLMAHRSVKPLLIGSEKATLYVD